MFRGTELRARLFTGQPRASAHVAGHFAPHSCEGLPTSLFELPHFAPRMRGFAGRGAGQVAVQAPRSLPVRPDADDRETESP